MKGNWQVFKGILRADRFSWVSLLPRPHNTSDGGTLLEFVAELKKVAKKSRIRFGDAAAILSYLGWIYHSNSYQYMQRHVLPYLEIRKLKDVIRNESRKQCDATTPIRH